MTNVDLGLTRHTQGKGPVNSCYLSSPIVPPCCSVFWPKSIFDQDPGGSSERAVTNGPCLVLKDGSLSLKQLVRLPHSYQSSWNRRTNMFVVLLKL